MLISYGGQHIQHMQKALELLNVKLTTVVSDITGVTGMAIINAIVAGQRDPLVLAQLRNERCHHSEEEIARALYGNWREEHLFELQQALELYSFYQRQLQACDLALAKHLDTFSDRSGGEILPPKPQKRKRGNNAPRFDVRQKLFEMAGVDLTVIEGIDESTALVILSEIGTDVSKFPTVKQFTSWLGLCPVHQGSGGKIKRRRVRKGQNRAARAFRLAAQGCHKAHHALGRASIDASKHAVAWTQGRRRLRHTRSLPASIACSSMAKPTWPRKEMADYEENYRKTVAPKASLAEPRKWATVSNQP